MRNFTMFFLMMAFIVSCGLPTYEATNSEKDTDLVTIPLSIAAVSNTATVKLNPVKATSLDAAANSKTFDAKAKNVFIAGNFADANKSKKLVAIVNALQKKQIVEKTKVKVYLVDIASTSEVAKTILKTHAYKADKTTMKALPVIVVAAHKAGEVTTSAEGLVNLKYYEDMINRTYHTKPVAVATAQKNLGNLSQEAEKLLVFTSAFCGPCKQMKPITDAMLNEGYNVEYIYNNNDPMNLFTQYDINSTPTYIFTNESGLTDRVKGMTTKQILTSKLKQLLYYSQTTP